MREGENILKLELLKNIRESKKITQEEMAKKLGYSDKSGYWHLENGKVKITTTIASKLKKILSLSDKQVFEIFFE